MMTPSSREAQSNPNGGGRPAASHATAQVTVHPVLFALFPVFFLYAPNQAAFGFDVTFKPALIIVSLVLLTWLALTVALGNSKRAALWTSFTWLLLFTFDSFWTTYVHLRFAAGLGAIGLDHQIKLGALLVTSTAFVICHKVRKDLDQATYLFNVIGTILVCMALTDVARGILFSPQAPTWLPADPSLKGTVRSSTAEGDRPDIYYIILDGYGRADQLRRLYEFNNDEFIDSLADQGFQVLPRAVSNYPQTLLSIASSLNLEYLHEMLGENLTGVQDRRFVRGLLEDNRTTKLLREAGYHITSIASPYYEANVVEADTVIANWRFPSVFEIALLDMTPLPTLLLGAGINLPYDIHRSRILFALDKLAEMPSQPGPKFVYCHVQYAHPPFVFDQRGGPINPDRPYTWLEGESYFTQQGTSPREYIDGYKGQVRFLNERLRDTLAAILANSKQPPIIVMQADHGPGVGTSLKSLERTDVEERYSIFSAFYLPGDGPADLYESMSSVNTFRIIFNRYFGTSYPLLTDELYYAPFEHPYDFTRVDSTPLATKLGVQDSHRPVQ